MRHLTKLMILSTLLLAVGCYVRARVSVAPATGPEHPAPNRARPAGEVNVTTTGPTGTAAPGPERPAEGQAGTCTTTADCPEGLGCFGDAGCDAVWTCQPRRPCTRDLVPYCGCDGETFRSSSTCITRPYSHRGPCDGSAATPGPPPPFTGTRPRPAPTPATVTGPGPATADPPDRSGSTAEGRLCQSSEDCGEGFACLGSEGCSQPATCQRNRPCTLDLAPFCGCDGQTFRGSSTCPRQSWAYRGACRPSDGSHPAPQ